MITNEAEANIISEKYANKNNEYNFKVIEVSGNLNDTFLSVSWVVTINEPSTTSTEKDDLGKNVEVTTTGKELFCTNGISTISKADDLETQKAKVEAEAIESAKAYNPNPRIIYEAHPLKYSAKLATIIKEEELVIEK